VSAQNGSRTFISDPKTLKLVQERAGNTLEAIGIGKDFLNRTQQVREKIDKWDYIKLKSFCTIKEMVSKERDHPQSERKYFRAITKSPGIMYSDNKKKIQ
jgi:hypothetical protein